MPPVINHHSTRGSATELSGARTYGHPSLTFTGIRRQTGVNLRGPDTAYGREYNVVKHISRHTVAGI